MGGAVEVLLRRGRRREERGRGGEAWEERKEVLCERGKLRGGVVRGVDVGLYTNLRLLIALWLM